MLVGSMRVSRDTSRQTTDLQRDALLQAGVDERHLCEDKASGARNDRPGLAQALSTVSVRAIVWWWGNSTSWAAHSRTCSASSPMCRHAVWRSDRSPNR